MKTLWGLCHYYQPHFSDERTEKFSDLKYLTDNLPKTVKLENDRAWIQAQASRLWSPCSYRLTFLSSCSKESHTHLSSLKEARNRLQHGEINQSHTCYSLLFPSLGSLEPQIIISLVCPYEKKTRVISADAGIERIIVPSSESIIKSLSAR